MTQWGLDTLFNPAKRHMDEEKRRLQSTRAEIGDNSGGKRIDLESGKVTIRRPGDDDDDTAAEAADEPSEETAPATSSDDSASSEDSASSPDSASSDDSADDGLTPAARRARQRRARAREVE